MIFYIAFLIILMVLIISLLWRVEELGEENLEREAQYKQRK